MTNEIEEISSTEASCAICYVGYSKVERLAQL